MLLLLASLLLLSVSGSPSTDNGVDVFVAGTENYPGFRIPAILGMDNGDLLMFAEGRFGGDHGHNDIVMKRSTDNGQSWSPLLKVYGESTASKPVTIGNPSPIAVRTRPGMIVLVACRQNSDVLTLTSTDYGHSWTNASYITPQVKLPGWTWVATGPPQGLQLESGRLLVAADHYVGKGVSWGSHSMYSDDLGQSWKISGSIDGDGGNECQAAPAANGSLLMNMRTRAGIRQFAWSEDQGASWSTPITSPFNAGQKYAGGGCEGSTVALPGSSKLVFSTPFSGRGRENMTLFVSTDNGASWGGAQQVYAGGSAYSALQPINASHVGLAFEKDGYKTINYRVLEV